MRGIAVKRSAAAPVLYWPWICVLAVAVLFSIGCSNSTSNPNTSPAAAATTSSTAPGGLPDPCSLITQPEVETAMGKGATMASVYNQRIGMQECHVKAASAGPVEEVIIVVHRVDQWDAIKKAMLPPSSNAKSVSGLGDDAFVGRAVGYNVRKGNKYVQVFGVLTNKDAANDQATHALAERAASRL